MGKTTETEPVKKAGKTTGMATLGFPKQTPLDEKVASAETLIETLNEKVQEESREGKGRAKKTEEVVPAVTINQAPIRITLDIPHEDYMKIKMWALKQTPMAKVKPVLEKVVIEYIKKSIQVS
ncbi:MAG: hypothetical protein LCH54_13625 [Bacteroidetes bacterium]|nr:hypothetical protein [Bacteroidota bacterium]